MNTPIMQEPALEMMRLLEELSEFSAPGPGTTRLLYTPEWSRAQLFLQEKMADLGLKVTVDKVGNVYGRLIGQNPEDQVILTGSHVDTVINGGKYDGAYGIVAAMCAIQYLKQTFGQPIRTLEVVSFCEEEGSRFPLTFWGSGNVTGMYDGSEAGACADTEGITLEAAMGDCGYGPDFLNAVDSTRREDIGVFVELHIEQGIVLETTATSIGIVQAIAGQRRFQLKVSGTANHAGTTPMNLRKDALAGTAEMLLALESLSSEAGEPLVATSGRLEVFPNTPNVIPGEVQFTLDIRHSEAKKLEIFCNDIVAAFQDIAEKRGLTLDLNPRLSAAPAPMNIDLCQSLERICQRQDRSYRTMVSGAGHDAQLFAPLCPTAMIFVPSREGISHSPDEYSSPEDLAAGMAVLTQLLYELAYLPSTELYRER